MPRRSRIGQSMVTSAPAISILMTSTARDKEPRHGRRRDNCQVDWVRDRLNVGESLDPEDAPSFWVYRVDNAAERGKIFQQGMTYAVRSLFCTNQGDYLRILHCLQDRSPVNQLRTGTPGAVTCRLAHFRKEGITRRLQQKTEGFYLITAFLELKAFWFKSS